MRKPIVTVFGSNDLSEAPEVEVLCEDLGRAIVDLGCRVACGGLGGSMTAVCRGAQSSRGDGEASAAGEIVISNEKAYREQKR